MKSLPSLFMVATAAALTLSAPASGQMWFFPDQAVPLYSEGSTSWVGATYGRGLNDASGELDALGAVFGNAGETLTLMGGLGFVTGDGDDEITLGATVGGTVAEMENGAITLQGGIGWISPGDFTFLRFPLGAAVQWQLDMAGGTLNPWVMPRLNVTRVSFDGESDTETDFAISGGVRTDYDSGFGFSVVLDAWASEGDTVWLLGLGAHYVLGSN